MSLTSYRAAPPRDTRSESIPLRAGLGRELGDWRAWRRPTLPPLERQYHGRRGFSRPSSGWDRVFGPSLWPPGRRSSLGEMTGGRCVRREVSGRGASACPWLERGVWRCTRAVVRRDCGRADNQADRAISTGQLRGLLPFHLRPINVVVCHGSWRDLVLRRVSRLDAFSGYPVRT